MILGLALPLLLAAPPAVPESSTPRTFRLSYGATVTDLPAGKPVRVWVPMPAEGPGQQVKLVKQALPAEAKSYKEPEYGNTMLYLEPTPDARGIISLDLEFEVVREKISLIPTPNPVSERFLKPDQLVPIDGKPLQLLQGRDLPDEPAAKARFLYDLVHDYMIYSKAGLGWGRGDVAWVCDSKAGNCTDFHSLYISLARSQKLPAKFEIGFGLPLEKGQGEIGGYHCWAFVNFKNHWVPVDISEARKLSVNRDLYYAQLPSNRVSFTTGRDLTLNPKQAGEPLNYFIFPYVEVEGKPHSAEKIKPRIKFADH